MTQETQIALGQTRAIKTMLFNVVDDLSRRSEEARIKGDHVLSSKLSIKANQAAMKVLDIRAMEDQIRVRSGLSHAIANLRAISSEAQDALERLKKAADAVKEAEKFISAVAKIVNVFT